ncbi:MAG: VOC family protein [Bacteroidetes bacterium]|nr:VOC family protein [Rhodothermia bacterium]MCX7907640.1 VOC family protein [Bacteroidota bacterium]MDW8286380.1 VOC family protein [Bacteroidota bacterium]
MEVLETCVYASDLEAARRFYEGVLGLPCFRFDPPRQAFFRAGSGVFLVFNPEETTRPGPLPAHGAQGSVHVCFRIPETELERWRRRLQEAGYAVQEALWPGGVRSLYVRDPAGNLVELAPARIWGF